MDEPKRERRDGHRADGAQPEGPQPGVARSGEAQYLEDPSTGDERVTFVSRSAATASPASSVLAADGADLPRLRERGTLFLLLFTVLLQAFSWHQLEGYQLADSVEYMERAQAFVSGEELQSEGAVRSLGFSSLLVPFFAVAELLGLEDVRAIVHLVRVFQMALGLALVFVCMRLGARIGGRAVGWTAGALCAINPAFLQYSVSPVSGVAAALFVGIALGALLERSTRKRAFFGGLMLGAAFLMAYQTLLISGAILLILIVRNRRAHFAQTLSVAAGFAIGILAQVVLDKISYGEWGVSIGNYLIENVLGVTVSALLYLGLQDQQWVRDLYAINLEHLQGSFGTAKEGDNGALQSLGWYFSELPTMLVYPVIALGVLGLLRAWRQLSWRSALLVGSLAISVAVMSTKGSKSFRLWLPLLPMIAPLCAWGLGLILGGVDARARLPRRLLAGAILIASCALGLRALLEVNTRRYGVYWEAMEFVNQAAALERTDVEATGETWEDQRVCSAYHWAVFGRGSEDLLVSKLSAHLDRWDELDEEQRELLLHELATAHWIILHDAVLSLHSDVTTMLNDRFEVATTFWNEDADRGLRDVLVLRNTSREERKVFAWSGERPRRMWELFEGLDPDVYRNEQHLDRKLPVPQSFERTNEAGERERLTLLGWEYESLPDSDFGWITYHWWAETALSQDYTFIDRLTVPKMHSWWRNDHQPGRGFRPTSGWSAGDIFREGFVVLPGDDLFKDEFNPIGGAFRRGDLIPVTLWVKCRVAPPSVEVEDGAEEAPAPAETPMLYPVAQGSSEPLEFLDAPGMDDDIFESSDGHLAMTDGLVRISDAFLPVGKRFAVPDDGKPVED